MTSTREEQDLDIAVERKAMALAVKNAPEAAAQSPFDRLAVSSLVGLVYVLGAIALVFYAIPALWAQSVAQVLNPFMSGALLVVAMIGAAAGLGWLGLRLVHYEPAHGLKGGIFVAFGGLVGVALTAWIVGVFFEWALSRWAGAWPVGAIISLASGLGLLFLFARWFFRPETEETLIGIEDQGWFSTTAYKKSQGLRVRRGTMLGILIMAGCGIWVLTIGHKTLVYGIAENANHWFVRIPFTDLHLQLLRDVRFSVPLLLTALTLWFTWRVVNWPAFADFLIATEAELNKVSWTTKKRLYQDTIVVLTTVVLMTLFLFVVDLTWGFLLSRVGVLHTDTSTQTTPGDKEQPW
jgi:preprotein translocase SecE subunit